MLEGRICFVKRPALEPVKDLGFVFLFSFASSEQKRYHMIQYLKPSSKFQNMFSNLILCLSNKSVATLLSTHIDLIE